MSIHLQFIRNSDFIPLMSTKKFQKMPPLADTVEWLFFRVTIFPNFLFLGVYVSNISEERKYVFSVSNFPVLCRF